MQAMTFVQLDRSFVPIRSNQVVTAETLHGWGGRALGAMSWHQILERPRVIVLAEALSGKTWEFKQQVKELTSNQKFALYTTIERLSDRGLCRTVAPEELKKFETWKRSSEPGWFFLDSVDEARLNHRDVELGADRLRP